MTDPRDSTIGDLAGDLFNQGYFETSIGGRRVEVSIPALRAVFGGEDALENAQRAAIVTSNAATSRTLSEIAARSPMGTEVNVVFEVGDFGQMSGQMR